MAGRNPEYEKVTMFTLILAWVILFFNAYFYAFPFFKSKGLGWVPLIEMELALREAGFYNSSFITKGAALVLTVLGGLLRTGKPTDKGWPTVITLLAIGVPLYLIRPANSLLYLVTTLTGYVVFSTGVFIMSRKFKSKEEDDDEDEEDTFEQCTRKMENKMSINLPMRFRWKHRWNNGWINIVNPARASIIMGTPGAGKTYSVIEPVLEQGAEKGFSMFVYDYKYPALSEIAYNEVKLHAQNYDVPPTLGIINFKDPRYSNRCNPLRPEYITDPADTTEIADTVMLNVNKAAVEKEDFFSMSAKVYLDALLWYLKIYCPPGGKPGDYCTFPHVIELMGKDYKKVFEILKNNPELEVKITPFINALEGGAQDQLQGQIASAQIPLNKFVSPALYWVLSKNEISLEINDPKRPMILCVGNDPERQSLYSTTLALFTAQMFKVINKPGKNKSMIILDELPTIFLKGLDNLIGTARSNKVCIFAGVQDKSQLKRDYGDKESTVILNTIGNHLVGQVSGETAKDYSHAMGKIKRVSKSVSRGEENESVSTSKHDEDKVPVDKIETLSQGEFIGKVADNNGQKVKKKLFCCEIVRPDYDTLQQQRKEKGWSSIPMLNDFDLDGVKEEVEANWDDLFYDYCKENFLKGQNDPETVSALRLDEEVKELMKATSENEYELQMAKEKITDTLWKKRIKETIDENYRNIKEEIKDLVDREYAKVIEKKNAITKEKKEKKTEDLLQRHEELVRKRKEFMKKKEEESEE